MSLTPGTRLGVYDVTAQIGEGGMGLVYRARDTKLNRDVALKVLPDSLASDPDRLARFTREAQTLASLNHPNIAHIHGLEEGGGVRALVMELVEGDDLSQRIARGAIPLDEALPIAKQIAEALEAAHEQGIIHRDLKPANIKVRADGTVKVLDFGLAKAMEPAAGSSPSLSMSPTITTPAMMTGVGVILGTAAYMSPEQARGKAVDKRADIWAFGAVLFEMLTGTRAFEGEDIADTLGNVIKVEPSWQRVPASMPPRVVQVMRACLQKNPKQRIDSAQDVRLALEGAFETPLAPPLSRGLAFGRVLPWTIAAAGALAAVAVLLLWPPWRRTAPLPLQRLEVGLGADVSLETTGLGGPSAVLSPDGRALAFVARAASGPPQLYVRPLDQLSAARIPGTDNAISPFFSPDGRWIAFFTEGKLKKVQVTGGAVVSICDVPSGFGAVGGSFVDADTIVVSMRGVGLARVSSAGGTPEPFLTLAGGEAAQRWPQVLPGGNAILFTSSDTLGDVVDAKGDAQDSTSTVVQRLPSGSRKVLQRGASYARYLPSGHLVFVRGGALFSAPFDLKNLETVGPPVPVLESVTSGFQGGAQFAASETGMVVYLPAGSGGNAAPISWMDHDGKMTALRSTPANWDTPRFSPNGQQLALSITGSNGSDAWLSEWARDTLTRVTSGGNNSGAAWSPDGLRITFASTRNSGPPPNGNLYWQRADGVGDVQRLTSSTNTQLPDSWHPSGKFLLFTELSARSGLDVMILPMDGDEKSGWKPGKPYPFVSTAYNEFKSSFSPDGRWVAYMSNETGRFEVYVRPFPGPGSARLISAGGGGGPAWSRSKHELFYKSADGHIMVVPYTTDGGSFRAERPVLWSDVRITRGFDLHPDGNRIAMAPQTAQDTTKADKVVFLFNFFDELRRLAPSPGR